MHFIEYWFAISPDNGSGTLESALIALPVLFLLTLHVKHWLAAGRWGKTRPSRARFIGPKSGRSSRYVRWVDCTIATNDAPPETRQQLPHAHKSAGQPRV
jgi:hypothetical protein